MPEGPDRRNSVIQAIPAINCLVNYCLGNQITTMKRPPSQLSDHTGYWLRILSNHISTSFAARLETHGVSVPQWNVLRVLHDHRSLPLKDLSARLNADPGALSRMVERLIALGWVIRQESATDRRAVAISLTSSARKLVPKLAHEADGNDREFFGCLSPGELETFQRTIHKLLASHPDHPKGSSIQ